MCSMPRVAADAVAEALDALQATAERRVALEDRLREAREDTHADIIAALRAFQAQGKNGIGEVARRARYDREHVRRIRRDAGLDVEGD